MYTGLVACFSYIVHKYINIAAELQIKENNEELNNILAMINTHPETNFQHPMDIQVVYFNAFYGTDGTVKPF